MTTRSTPDFTLWNQQRQQVGVTFDGPDIVSDTGLLTLRHLDKQLGYLQDLAQRLPDPRSPQFIQHSVEALLTQQVYQILADYPDCNDADTLRHDRLFRTLADRSAPDDLPLASASTLARFQYAFTRRQCDLPPEERPAYGEMYRARTDRIRILNQFLVDTFVRTRRQPPAAVILDLDPTDDPTHGRQALAAYHGYYGQHQYFPLLIFDGASRFPPGAWLRPGTVAGATGAVDALRLIVTTLRRAWPGVLILVRDDHSLAVPAVYEFCEAEGLLYAFGYASNAVLERRTAHALEELELYYQFYGRRFEPHVQRFEVIEDYQAGEWSRPRRILCKLASISTVLSSANILSRTADAQAN
jgi:Transposase DDE domain group 1